MCLKHYLLSFSVRVIYSPYPIVSDIIARVMEVYSSPTIRQKSSWHDAFVFPNSEKHSLASTSNEKPVILENTRIAVNQTVAKPKRRYRKDTPFRNIEAFYLFVVQNDCVWNYSDQRFSYSSFQSADFHNCR